MLRAGTSLTVSGSDDGVIPITRPDIVFTRQRVAIFVDGCFWHSCPEHGTRPATNIAYWNATSREVAHIGTYALPSRTSEAGHIAG